MIGSACASPALAALAVGPLLVSRSPNLPCLHWQPRPLVVQELCDMGTLRDAINKRKHGLDR